MNAVHTKKRHLSCNMLKELLIDLTVIPPRLTPENSKCQRCPRMVCWKYQFPEKDCILLPGGSNARHCVDCMAAEPHTGATCCQLPRRIMWLLTSAIPPKCCVQQLCCGTAAMLAFAACCADPQSAAAAHFVMHSSLLPVDLALKLYATTV
jgi:hypothetical protein